MSSVQLIAVRSIIFQGVRELGCVFGLEPNGRRFKSCLPDQLLRIRLEVVPARSHKPATWVRLPYPLHWTKITAVGPSPKRCSVGATPTSFANFSSSER